MAQIKVRLEHLDTLRTVIQQQATAVQNVHSAVERVRAELDLETLGKEQLEQNLIHLRRCAEETEEKLLGISSAIGLTADRFSETDRRLSQQSLLLWRQAASAAQPMVSSTTALAGLFGLSLPIYCTLLRELFTVLEDLMEKIRTVGTEDAETALHMISYANSTHNWSPRVGKPANSYSEYAVVKGFREDFVLWQRDYHNGKIACTATADAIVASIVTGKVKTPDKSYWAEDNCIWPNTKVIPNTKDISVAEQCRIIGETVQQGNPVIFRVPGHSVVAIGLKQGVNPTEATPSDILIIDPGDGKVKTADEIYSGWYEGSGKLSMQDRIGWSLRVAK